jgi:integrase
MHREDVKLTNALRAAMGRAGVVEGYRHSCRAWHCEHAEVAPDASPRYCPTPHGQKKTRRKLWPQPVVRELTWKDLRGTASLYIGNRVPMAVVQEVLRHADPRIGSKRYAHLEQDYLGAEMRKLSLVSSIDTPSTQISEGADEAANGDSESYVIP